jgi:hypothetical protein
MTETDRWSVAAHPEAVRLARDLATPPLRCDITGLAQLWTVDALRVLCQRPSLLEDHPELPLRLRGAFGRALAAQPVRHSRAGGERARAYDVMFEPLAQRHGGIAIAKPFVIRAWTEATWLVVELRLFGDGAAWLPDCARALVAALEGGVSLKAGSRLRTPLVVVDVLRKRETGLDAIGASAPTVATLTFRTPVAVRSGGRVAGDPAAILRAIPRRIATMARWQMVELDEDWAALAAGIETIALDDRDLVRYRWSRHSLRGGDAAIPMAGHLGALHIEGRLQRLAPYLRLAAGANIGSHASLGLGWFDLALC